MGYSDQDFAQRFSTLGDQAEKVFEEASPLGAWEINGWRRPKVSMRWMTEPMKASPDFYSGGYLVEVVGCGSDKILKFRESKREALDVWHKHIQDVAVFVYNSKLEEWWLVEWPVFRKLWDKVARADGVKEFSSDGNRYAGIAVDLIAEVAFVSGKHNVQ